jgi:hypothetical protein
MRHWAGLLRVRASASASDTRFQGRPLSFRAFHIVFPPSCLAHRYFYVNGRYFHASNLASWNTMAKPVRGSTAKHKGGGLLYYDVS